MFWAIPYNLDNQLANGIPALVAQWKEIAGFATAKTTTGTKIIPKVKAPWPPKHRSSKPEDQQMTNTLRQKTMTLSSTITMTSRTMRESTTIQTQIPTLFHQELVNANGNRPQNSWKVYNKNCLHYQPNFHRSTKPVMKNLLHTLITDSLLHPRLIPIPCTTTKWWNNWMQNNFVRPCNKRLKRTKLTATGNYVWSLAFQMPQ